MKTHIHLLSQMFDLTDYEAKIYSALHSHGTMLLKPLSKYAIIPRTALYAPLEKLLKKGLVSETVFGKRKYYSATPLRILRHKLDANRATLENMIRDLNSSHEIVARNENLESSLYLGAEGIKTAGMLFMDETKEKTWYSFENLALTTDRVGFEFEDFYINERIKRGIKSKMILSLTEETQAVRKILNEDKKHLRETVLLSPHQYPLQTTVVATKGIALVINPAHNPFALIIRNDAIADTFTNLHKCIWDRYKG